MKRHLVPALILAAAMVLGAMPALANTEAQDAPELILVDGDPTDELTIEAGPETQAAVMATIANVATAQAPRDMVNTFTVTDARGNGAGWHVKVRSVYRAENTPIVMPDYAVEPDGTSSPPPVVYGDTFCAPALNTSVTTASAALNTGMGRYIFGFNGPSASPATATHPDHVLAVSLASGPAPAPTPCRNVTVAKTVVGAAPADDFTFSFACDNGQTPPALRIPPAGGSDSTTFVPNGTSCTVTEDNPQGAQTTYSIDGSAPTVGTAADVTVNADTTLAFTNDYDCKGKFDGHGQDPCDRPEHPAHGPLPAKAKADR